MKYPKGASVAVPSVTGAVLQPAAGFTAWLPSTWPKPDGNNQLDLVTVMGTIFRNCIMDEIDNVVADAREDLTHRGHVIAIALLCALDAISSYGYGAYNGRQIPQFVSNHFPSNYKAHGRKILNLYRHAMVHSWNLFGASVLPGREPVRVENGTLSFGLLDFKAALWKAVDNYLAELPKNQRLLSQTLRRYRALVRTSKP